jgi:glyoxylase-like metal-dependent hydrolase (beta-lactamase superfamily II)
MFDEVADGVYRRRYDFLDLNVGVVVGDDGVLVVDTRASHREADELIAELGTLTPLPVRWVVNTHWHWDHTFGNARFLAAEIWGHQQCRRVLLERPEEMKQEARPWFPETRHAEIDEVEIVAPARVFSERASLEIGREVVMTYHGRAHTDADIVVRIPDAGAAFLGDLVEQGAPPVFIDAYPIEWPDTLAAAGDVGDMIVPGHGDVMDRRALTDQLQELREVARLASEVVMGRVPLEEATARGPYPAEVMRSALERATLMA